MTAGPSSPCGLVSRPAGPSRVIGSVHLRSFVLHFAPLQSLYQQADRAGQVMPMVRVAGLASRLSRRAGKKRVWTPLNPNGEAFLFS